MKIPHSVEQLLEQSTADSQDSSRFENKKKPSNSLDRKSQRKAARNEVKTRKRERHSVPPVNSTPKQIKPVVVKKKNPVPKQEIVVKKKNPVPKKKEKSEQAKMDSLLASNPQFHKLLTSAGSNPSAVDQDEMNMRYYAKKLGIKKAGSIPQALHDDGLGFLFKGITIPGMETLSKEEQSDDSEEEDMDEEVDLEIDELETEELMMKEEDSEDSEDSDEEMDIQEDGSSSDEEKEEVASSGEEIEEPVIIKTKASPSTSKYLPPHLRKADTANPASESRSRVKRALIGPLNRLNSTNLDSISVEIESVLLKNTRNGIHLLLIS
jgi:nucleolar MIF4G domain-containing protein 1